MTIVIEGCDGTGKTSVAKVLAEKYGCDVVHMTGKDPADFEFYSQSLRKKNVIYDRNVLGELVYPYVFRRSKQLQQEEADRLVRFYKDHGVYFFVLTADAVTCAMRLTARGNEDQKILDNISYILAKFKAVAFEYGIPEIDTSHRSVSEVAKQIMTIIEEKEKKND